MGVTRPIVIAAAVLALCGALRAQEPAAPVQAPADAGEMLARLRDLPPKLAGWQIEEGAHSCDRQCLPQHLPLDAATVLAYNYQWNVTLTYVPQTPPQPLVVDVFAMADELDAFGLFAQARNERAMPAAVTTESYWTGDQLHVWRGRFYVRVTPKLTDELLRAAALAAGEAVADMLPLPARLPLLMRIMPAGRAQPQGLHYYRQNLLNEIALGDGLVNRYGENGTTLTLALLRAGDGEGARQLLTVVRELLRHDMPATVMGTLGQEAYVIQSARHGLCYVMREGGYVGLALGVHDRDTAEGLLRIMATNIRILR